MPKRMILWCDDYRRAQLLCIR